VKGRGADGDAGLVPDDVLLSLRPLDPACQQPSSGGLCDGGGVRGRCVRGQWRGLSGANDLPGAGGAKNAPGLAETRSAGTVDGDARVGAGKIYALQAWSGERVVL
jgi:hypothetical protein